MQQQWDLHRPRTRRHFLRMILAVGAGVLVAGCGSSSEQTQAPASLATPDTTNVSDTAATPPNEQEQPAPQPTPSPVVPAEAEEPTAVLTPTAAAVATTGLLLSRPAAPPAAGEITPGVQPLGLVPDRDTLLYVPARYTPDQAVPLVVLCHGAGGITEHGLSLLQGLADEANLLLLAPASRRQTWDVIRGGYGPDVRLIDQALGQVFSRFNVDRARLAIGGFSDGASYALSLGLTNGDLFTHIMAFSPGFMAPARQEGKPRIYISHGTRDDVLPIDACSRKIVPRLERAGYDVLYHEFDGPHTVPPEMTQEARGWFTAT